jgi:ABC-type branched-subunit amino acid transport system ATPase component
VGDPSEQKTTGDQPSELIKPAKAFHPNYEHGKSIFLIGDMNGAGKTSIMEVVNFVFTGERETIKGL